MGVQGQTTWKLFKTFRRHLLATVRFIFIKLIVKTIQNKCLKNEIKSFFLFLLEKLINNKNNI